MDEYTMSDLYKVYTQTNIYIFISNLNLKCGIVAQFMYYIHIVTHTRVSRFTRPNMRARTAVARANKQKVSSASGVEGKHARSPTAIYVDDDDNNPAIYDEDNDNTAAICTLKWRICLFFFPENLVFCALFLFPVFL